MWQEWGGVVLASVAGLPLAVLAVLVLAGWRRRRGVPARLARRHSLAEVAMVVGTVPWIWMILTPRRAPRQTWLVPLTDLANQVLHTPPVEVAVQAGGNLLVFAALGFFGPIRFPALAGPVRLLLLGAAGSALVETLQYVLDLGRVSSVDDVLLNAAGAALASLLSRPWWRTEVPPPPPARATLGAAARR
ncbi:VanZ family protein [Micromonospora sp. NPDC049559]|uniref:VanZ family protein n=1 Tax=Micromonospora sp. NPDC049559 TaxID=3155923 RepID=UPI00344835ED